MQPNRREALKMLGSTFFGAALGGGATYADIKTKSGYTATAMTNYYHAMGKYEDIPHEDLKSVIEEVLEDGTGKMVAVAATTGAVTFNVLHNWIWRGTFRMK